MADESVTRAVGLYTSPNSLSYIPSGALKEALNTVINYPGKIESRRGFERVGYRFGSTGSRGNTLASYRGALFVQYDTDKLAFDSGVAFVDYAGSYAQPSPGLRMKFAEMGLNFFFTSATGVKMTDSAANEPMDAGLPRGPVATVQSDTTTSYTSFTGDPGAGWMRADAQTAYITVIGTRDANDNVKLGEASNPFFVVNPPEVALAAGDISSTGVFVNVAVPDGTGKFYQPGEKVTLTLAPADANFPNAVYPVVLHGANWLTDRFCYQAAVPFTGLSAQAGTITGAFRNIQVAAAIPAYFTSDYFIRFYRAKASSSYTTVPNADYYLVNEVPITPTIISAGVVTFIDSTPDEALQDPFYNNVNVGGEAVDGSPENDNARAPLCRDLTTFDHRLWGANLQERRNLTVSLLGVGDGAVYGSPNGLQVGDTVTVGGVTFTAVGWTLPLGVADFNLFASIGEPAFTQSDLIRLTAQGLALTVAKHPTCTVTASYSSQSNEFPGKLFFESRSPTADTFTFASSRNTAWSPDPTGGLTSTGEAATNGLWFSKQDQPEAVPRLNRESVGERNHNILRIKALGERLYVFTDRGIYTITGTYPYRVDLVSKTAVLVAPDSLADFDDSLYCLTTQGITRVNASGAQVLSTPIELDIKRLYGGALPVLKTATAAIGYESYRKYIISMPTTLGDTVNTQQFVYDVATTSFNRWDRPANCFYIVPETDTLYMLRTDENSISVERRNQAASDYSDESFPTTISAISSDKKTLTLSNTLLMAAGDLVFQGTNAQALVESVDTAAGTVTLHQTSPDWVTGAATLYPAISCKVVWSEVFAGKPNYQKHFPAVTFHFFTPGISFGHAIFSSDLGPSEDLVDLNLGGWGDPQWGQFAWAQPAGPKNQRVFITKNAPRGNFLSAGVLVREARGVWSLLGYTAEVETMSPRNSR